MSSCCVLSLPPQATFLRTASSQAQAEAGGGALRAELEALEQEELDKRARASGLSTRGGKEAMVRGRVVMGVAA